MDTPRDDTLHIELDALMTRMQEWADDTERDDYLDEDIRKLLAALAAERDRADRAEAQLVEVRRYAEDRSIHHRAKKDSVVGSWRIASDLLAILDSEATA